MAKINGTKSDNTLGGLFENDIITGGKGNDQLFGDYGNDTYIYNKGDGNDTIYDDFGSKDNVTFQGLLLKDISKVTITPFRIGAYSTQMTISFNGGGSVKTTGVERFKFGDGTVVTQNELSQLSNPASGSGGSSTTGTRYNDNITGNNSDNKFAALRGNDTVSGLGGNDFLDGGSGNDTIYGGIGNDWIVGGVENDRLEGGVGDDKYTYYVGDGVDKIYDASGLNDTLEIKGLRSSAISRVENINANRYATITFSVGGVVEVRSIIDINKTGINAIETFKFDDKNYTQENLRLLSITTNQTIGNDTIWGYDFSDDTISGLGGNDVIKGFGGNDILNGGSGNNTIDGGNGNDTITAGDVSNVIDRKGNVIYGGNTIDSGNGDDRITVGDGYDTIDSGNGNDRIAAGDGDDMIDCGNGNDTIVAGDGDDVIHDDSGNDTYIYEKGDGDDHIYDEIGTNDTIIFKDLKTSDISRVHGNIPAVATITFKGGGSVYIGRITQDGLQTGLETFKFTDKTLNISDLRALSIATNQTNGNDTIWGFDFTSDMINGLTGDDDIFGYDGNDTLNGGLGNDELYSGDDNDVLIGGLGNDVLIGGLGKDYLNGGLGSDRFKFNVTDSQIASRDFIDNFQTGVDKVETLFAKDKSDFTVTTKNGVTTLTYELANFELQIDGSFNINTDLII